MNMRSEFGAALAKIDQLEFLVRELEGRWEGDRRVEPTADPGSMTDAHRGAAARASTQEWKRREGTRARGTLHRSLSSNGAEPLIAEVQLDAKFLDSKRIVAHDGAHSRSNPYAILRTQIVRSVRENGWQMVGVTSPTSGCGKTLTAINLAFSIARQPGQSAMLLDLDLQKPKIFNYLGLQPSKFGLVDVLKQRKPLENVAVRASVENQRVVVVPTAASQNSSETMNSPAIRAFLRNLRQTYTRRIIIVDLPPMLGSDDVIAVLPQLDCVLLVMAVGRSKIADLEECRKYLQSKNLLQVVVNKAADVDLAY